MRRKLVAKSNRIDFLDVDILYEARNRSTIGDFMGILWEFSKSSGSTKKGKNSLLRSTEHLVSFGIRFSTGKCFVVINKRIIGVIHYLVNNDPSLFTSFSFSSFSSLSLFLSLSLSFSLYIVSF